MSIFGSVLGTIGGKIIGSVVGNTADYVDMSDLPSGTQVGGNNFSSRGGFQAGRAQLMPFGRTDRVSRAMQDQRVANKLMKMAAGYRVPTPNLRMGSNITLASAKRPAVSLARKYSKGTVKA